MNRRNLIKNSLIIGTALVAAPNFVFGNNSKLDSYSLKISPMWDVKGKLLRHSWAGMGNIDQMRWILRRDMQEQLALCHKEIGLRHVRSVGIFDDEMWVLDNNPANFLNKSLREVKRTNWRVPDYIFDSLLNIGINPIITTCFTPKSMASGRKTCFDTKSNVTPPKNMQEWSSFVNCFVRHNIDRYGIDNVKNWYFEAWNEPNLDGFWTGGKKAYLELYKYAFDVLKSIDPSLKIGGPSTARAEWIEDFMEFGTKNSCLPDYIIGHCYNNDSASAPLTPFDGPQGDKENKSPNFTSGVVRGVRKLLDQASFKGEFHMNEWGLSWHPFAPVRETANEAAFIVKTLNEVSQNADYFAYWCLSDIYNQVGYGREAFHGNYGMLSMDGLRKPSYFAHQLMCMLGSEQIPFKTSNNNDQTSVLISRNESTIQVLAYSFDIQYKVGDTSGKCAMEIELPINSNLRLARIYRLDSKENNIINSWHEMGSPDYPNRMQIDKLLGVNTLQSEPLIAASTKSANGLTITVTFETPGVVLIEIPTTI